MSENAQTPRQESAEEPEEEPTRYEQAVELLFGIEQEAWDSIPENERTVGLGLALATTLLERMFPDSNEVALASKALDSLTPQDELHSTLVEIGNIMVEEDEDPKQAFVTAASVMAARLLERFP